MTQAQNVETRLREMILNMEIGPGERLTERWAEAQLGASRTPVRAALLRLETDGLICREGRGWMVTPLDIQEIEQLFVYREVLEVAAIQLAAKHANIEVLDRLEAALEACRPGTSTREAHQLGTEFHVQLAALAANDFIARGVADAMTRLSRARWLDTTPEHQGWDEHRAVLAALREGDAAKASALVSQHLRDSRDRLMKILTEGRRSLRARGIMVEWS
ncbi:GntR family transcriptional regulator [Ralstonia pseudosolanacearum]|uniref:Putative transcription regulator protein, HTH GntR family n=1 Tax=Ralstonia solanacearum TaxID=305 RepID=A0A0S4WIX0_RALSL|nr:putative transcription regulator protein, HTH GntR family [Ralstonia solanacearum]